MKKTIQYSVVIIISFMLLIIGLKIFDKILSKYTGLGTPLIYKYSKIYGYDLLPNQEIKRLGNNIKINNMGMRSSKDWDNNHSNSILFVGDSIPYGGSKVSNKDLFAEKTCKKITQKIKEDFICGNMSANGYGLFAINERIKFKEINNEKVLVITLAGSNFIRGFNHIGNQPFWGKEIENFFPATTELIFIFVDKIRNRIKYNFGEDDIYTEKKIKYYLDLMLNFKKILKDNNKPYLIFYSPEKSEINDIERYSFFKNFMSNNFENFFDLTDEIKDKKDSIYLDHVHLNKLGHELYAKIISKKIIEFIDK